MFYLKWATRLKSELEWKSDECAFKIAATQKTPISIPTLFMVKFGSISEEILESVLGNQETPTYFVIFFEITPFEIPKLDNRFEFSFIGRGIFYWKRKTKPWHSEIFVLRQSDIANKKSWAVQNLAVFGMFLSQWLNLFLPSENPAVKIFLKLNIQRRIPYKEIYI